VIGRFLISGMHGKLKPKVPREKNSSDEKERGNAVAARDGQPQFLT
jgi:hypothetical protein